MKKPGFSQTVWGQKSPCLNCEKRKSGCHATCETYNQYRHNIKEAKENYEARKNFL